MDKQYDVFISYSRQDSSFTQKLIQKLDEWGYTFWIDVNGIESGELFKRKIVKAITNSKVFLFISSSNSNQSEWTIKEVGFAISKKKTIIPICIDNAKFNDELLFNLQYLDRIEVTSIVEYAKGLERLHHALHAHIHQPLQEQSEELTEGLKMQVKRTSNCNGTHRNWMIILALCFGILLLSFFIWLLYPIPPYLTTNTSYLRFPAHASSQELTINLNKKWVCSGDSSLWMHLANSENEVTVSVDSNTNAYSRSATLQVSTLDNTIRRSIIIEQSALTKVSEPNPKNTKESSKTNEVAIEKNHNRQVERIGNSTYLSVSQENISVGSTAGKISIIVSCNSDWKVTNSYSQLYTLYREGNEVTITYSANPNTKPRSDHFNIETVDGSKDIRIYFNQAAKNNNETTLYVSQSNFKLTKDGGIRRVRIVSNKDWDYIGPKSDCYIIREGNSLKVAVPPLTQVDDDSRVFEILIKTNDKEKQEKITLNQSIYNKDIPVALFHTAWANFNIMYEGKKQTEIHGCFFIDHMKGKKAKVIVWVYDKEGSNQTIGNVDAENAKYLDQNRLLCATRIITPTDDESFYKDFRLYFPNSLLTTSGYFRIEIQNDSTKEMLAESKSIPFTLNE